ncbi:hypothetical protein CER22_29375 [Bacillus sp. K2I17]|nr:hypothetical protein CER22_29375 [Bacillus sp. K2I17]
MHIYTNPLLPIHNSPHNGREYSSNLIKPIPKYLQKIRRKIIKTVDMRTNRIECEYYFPKIIVFTSVVIFI